jgi:hypothetical protein
LESRAETVASASQAAPAPIQAISAPSVASEEQPDQKNKVEASSNPRFQLINDPISLDEALENLLQGLDAQAVSKEEIRKQIDLIDKRGWLKEEHFIKRENPWIQRLLMISSHEIYCYLHPYPALLLLLKYFKNQLLWKKDETLSEEEKNWALFYSCPKLIQLYYQLKKEWSTIQDPSLAPYWKALQETMLTECDLREHTIFLNWLPEYEAWPLLEDFARYTFSVSWLNKRYPQSQRCAYR